METEIINTQYSNVWHSAKEGKRERDSIGASCEPIKAWEL